MAINSSTVNGNYALAEGGGVYNNGFAGNRGAGDQQQHLKQ